MLDWSTHAHDYQARGAAHLWNSGSTLGASALWLSPGYGKTTITLHAFKALRDAGRARSMLIIAPLRVVQTVWGQEIENWSSLKGLVAARLHGPKKEQVLKRRDVNVWLINYEGLPWLAKMVKDGKVDQAFDVVVFDEVRRMKDAQGKRFKAVRPIAAMAKFRWGLTGTPASNGLLDLFGQFLILDNGAALGNRITHYRSEFFEQGWDGFSWVPRPGAAEQIESRIERYVFRADGMLDLPDFVTDNRVVVLDTASRKHYDAMKKEMVAELGEDTTITAANAAVLAGKLKQMANGRVYDEQRNVIKIHSAKQDALRELLEELGDEQLLIAYEYNHDLAQIREVLGDDVPYLGAGVNESTAMEYVDMWNRGDIKQMAVHPASAGHGLNLQKSGAHHILWWGPTFDLDWYIQLNDRLRRQGNTADAVVLHTFITERSVDETAIRAREEKATVQDALLEALTVEFGDRIMVGEANQNTQETPVNTTTLQFKSDAAQAAPAPAANPFAQGGAPAPAANPFAAAASQSAPAANPFAASGQAQAQAPQTAQPSSPANPFATAPAATTAEPPPPNPAVNPFANAQPVQETQMQPAAVVEQQQAIRQDVQAAPPATAEQTAPANPFAANKGVIEDAQVVEHTSAGPVERAEAAVEQFVQKEIVAPVAHGVKVSEGLMPLYLHIPLDKAEKVLAAIGRALK